MRFAANQLSSRYQSFQRVHVPQVISRIVNRRLCDECSVLQPPIIQQGSKYLQSEPAPTNVLMPVEAGPAFRLRVIAMPHAHVLEPDRTIKMLERQIAPFVGHNVVSRNVRM